MNLKSNFNKIAYYFRRYGFFETLKKVLKRLLHIRENRKSNQEQYVIWMKNNELNEEEVKCQRKFKFEINPKISIVVPMYNTNEVFFKELIESLKNQTYLNWELCLADGSEILNENLKKYYENDSRIKYKFLNSNKGISENTNKAIEMATGDYIGFLDHDDLLSINALFEIVKVVNNNVEIDLNIEKGNQISDIQNNFENVKMYPDFIYTDEDKIDENGERFEPYFKPDFSPETLECNNYITHFVVIKRELVEKIGRLDSRFNGAQDFDYVLRATEKANKIVHISKILYHWRVHRGSTANLADSKPYAYEAGIKVIEEHIKRIGKKGKVEQGQDVPGIYKIKYDVIGNPKVSILIPNKDNINLLKNCINSILKLTIYSNYEIIIIENNSEKKETFAYYNELIKNPKIKVLNYNANGNKEFNYSALINFGVKNVDGDYILQLNNDTRLLTGNWLETFIGYAQNKEIGAIGARLYYKDKTIQHAGIIVGLSGIAGNMLVNLPYGKHAYFGREAATRNCLAVTGACLFCRKELYEEVGYMDEKNFKIAFNDVDFCLKIAQKGYRNLYNPYIELIHYESKSRGYEYSKEKEERFKNEANMFKTIWKNFLDKGDPYYNKNFTRETCNFDIETKNNKFKEYSTTEPSESVEVNKKGDNNKNVTLKVFEFFENIGLWILEKMYLKKLAEFYREHIEGMRYLICGGLSTVVNIVTYYIGVDFIFNNLSSEILIVNVSDNFSFILSLIFAYWVNKTIVFNSKCENIRVLLREICTFMFSRLFTQAISLAMMNFAVIIKMSDKIMKILANIVVIIVNFILSKLIIFKKNNN